MPRNSVESRLSLDSTGFTLVEIMIVMAIIGIISALAIPSYLTYVARSRQTEAKTFLAQLYSAEKTFALDQASFTVCIWQLGLRQEAQSFYYKGFYNQSSSDCGPYGNMPCNQVTYKYDYVAAENACNCTGGSRAGVGSDCTFIANQGNPPSPSSAWEAHRDTFTAGAIGYIHNNRPADTWTINERKQLKNTQSGL